MKIAASATGETLEAQLEEDQFMLSAAIQTGWRIVSASSEERAMLDAHGFGSGRVQ